MSGYLGAASKVSSDSPLVFPNHLYGHHFHEDGNNRNDDVDDGDYPLVLPNHLYGSPLVCTLSR